MWCQVPPRSSPLPSVPADKQRACTQTHSWCPQQGQGEALLCSVTETSCPELTSARHKLAFVSLCPQYWRQVYLITVLAMILAVFFAQIHPSYLTQQWHRLRSIIFCSVSGYGIIPTIHWVWLNGGIGASIVQEFAPRVFVMYFIAAVAFLFYISKVPERYFPGQLNYLGSSHQVWHILAVVMLYWWHQSTVYIMQYRHSKPCPEYSADL